MDQLCSLVVFRARDLPKTDTFSKIDPYVVIQAGGTRLKTTTIDDNDNPTWNETFFYESSVGPNGIPSSVIRFDLYDSDVGADTHACFCELNPSAYDLNRLGMVELPLQHTKSKYANKGSKKATLVVGITGWINTYPRLRSLVAAVPGVILNDFERRLYIPVGSTGLYLGVEYEQHAVDIKLYLTVPNPHIYVDLMLVDRPETKMRRRIHPRGQMIYQNLVAYQELKIDDLSIATNFNNLMVMCFTRVPIMSTTLDKVVEFYGWKGRMNFESASKKLHNVDVDKKEREVYMSVEPYPPVETLLIVDWDEDNVDIKLGVLATPTTGSKGFDLTIDNKDVKTTSQIFNPPKQKLNGKFLFSRIFELDDVPFGSTLSDMAVYKYELRDLQQWSVQSLVPLH